MLRNLLSGDWGVLALGGRRVPVWLIVTLGGLVGWFGSVLLATGADALSATWTALALLVPLILLATLTRTVGLRLVAVFCLLGGAMVGAALLWVMLFELVSPAHDRVRATVQPIAEELLKLAPLLVFLWLRRRDRSWSLTATDVLLLGAASGVAFGLVEDSYIRHSPFTALWQGPGWLPAAMTPDYGARLIVGHGVWTTVAAGGIAIALLLRARRRLSIAIAAAAVAWPMLDHINNNTISLLGRSASDDALVNMLRVVTGNGWWLAYGMVAIVALVIAADLAILLRTWPGPFMRLRADASTGYPERWRLTRFGRAVAMVRWQVARASRSSAGPPPELAALAAEIRVFTTQPNAVPPVAATEMVPLPGELQP